MLCSLSHLLQDTCKLNSIGPAALKNLQSNHAVTPGLLWGQRNMNIQTQDCSRKLLMHAPNQPNAVSFQKRRGPRRAGGEGGGGGKDLLVEALHGQQACLRLLGALFGGLGGGEGFAVQGSEVGLGP